MKWQINADDAPFVAAVFAGVMLPVGDKDLTSDQYDPEFAVFWTYSGALEWFGTAKFTEPGNRYKLENAKGIGFHPGNRDRVPVLMPALKIAHIM